MTEKLEFYRKPYLASKPTQASVPGTSASVQSGILTQASVPSAALSVIGAPFSLGISTVGFFDPKTGLSVSAGSTQVTTGKMLMLAQSSFHSVTPNNLTNDFIGTHGGYSESYKSRGINPRYITAWQKVVCAAPEAAVCHLGNTNFTNTTTIAISDGGTGYVDGSYNNIEVTGGTGTGMTVNITVVGGIITSVEDAAQGQGYTAGDNLTPVVPGPAPTTPAELELEEYGSCNYIFHCGQTYNLQVAIGGEGVLSVMNHEVPRWVSAFGGCCPEGSVGPTPIDSTLIMIQWAKKIMESPYFKHFLKLVVYDQDQVAWFANAEDAVAAGAASTQIWDNYVSTGYSEGTLAGIRFQGAYVDTTFGNCSFQYLDSTGIIDPVRITDLSLVDEKGQPCNETLCFVCEHAGYTGQGFGEDVIREFIDDTSRRTNHFPEDQRMREIENGSLLSSFNRSGLYTRYILRHKVPHNENISQQFSDVNYELNIYIPCDGAVTPNNAALEALMTAWLASVNSPVALETFAHTPFVYSPI